MVRQPRRTTAAIAHLRAICSGAPVVLAEQTLLHGCDPPTSATRWQLTPLRRADPPLWSAEFAHEALHRLVASGEAGLGHQILPDADGVAALTQAEFDGRAKGFANTGGRNRICIAKRIRRRWTDGVRVGGHRADRNGRFCRRAPTGRLDGNSCGLQVSACRFTTYPSFLPDATKRPSQPPQSDDLLLLLFVVRSRHCSYTDQGTWSASMSWGSVPLNGRF